MLLNVIMNNLKRSGLIFFLAGSLALMGIITAEATYPVGYSTFKSEISDLGATRQPDSISYEPSSSIFNSVMFFSGLMILIATFNVHKYFKKWGFTIPVILFGLGLAGVGAFPGNLTPYHGMSAMLAFLSGGVTAIMAFKITTPPFRYIGILFGSIALATWCIAVFSPSLLVPFIGAGGTERWVAYPLMLWLAGFGGYLMHNTIIEK
jgi:hypothetical membrane protein